MPAVPRSRYAAVITTAMVGAGVVALGASTTVPDAKLEASRLSTVGGVDTSLMDRSEAAERTSRADRERGGLATSIVQHAPDVWLLPMHGYQLSSSYGTRWGTMHNGVDLAAPTGTPIYTVHSGTVTHSRWSGGYGYLVIVEHDNGVETLYAHASELLVYEGQEVAAGEMVALTGNTGYSLGPHLHLEVHVDGVPQDPISWLAERGVDIMGQVEEIYGQSG